MLIFSAKNIRILYIESTKTVSEMTLNELVKLTMLWTTGPRIFWHPTINTLKVSSVYSRYILLHYKGDNDDDDLTF